MSIRSEAIFVTLATFAIWIGVAVASTRLAEYQRNGIQFSLRPTPTATVTATPGWWAEIALATPELPALPALPQLSVEQVPGGAAEGPVPFTPLSCPGPQARIEAITAAGVWWLIQGTAALDADFWYWKAELSADGQGWTLLYRSEAPVTGGRLMEFNTTTVPPGRYQLRLLAVDRTGNYPEPCVVEVMTGR